MKSVLRVPGEKSFPSCRRLWRVDQSFPRRKSLVVETFVHDAAILPAAHGNLHDLHWPHALDVDVVLPFRERRVVIGSVGENAGVKSLDCFLQVLARLHPGSAPDTLL